MRLCIVAPNEHIDAIRQTAIENGVPEAGLLAIPVSKTGELPATHWFCNYKVSQEMCEKLLALRTHSEMEITERWKDFLKSRELKIISK